MGEQTAHACVMAWLQHFGKESHWSVSNLGLWEEPALSLLTVDGPSQATHHAALCSFFSGRPSREFDNLGEGISIRRLVGPLFFAPLHLNIHRPLEGPCSR